MVLLCLDILVAFAVKSLIQKPVLIPFTIAACPKASKVNSKCMYCHVETMFLAFFGLPRYLGSHADVQFQERGNYRLF